MRGRWRCETRIASLPTHAVWRARDELLDRPVAVRIYPHQTLLDPAARAHLEQVFSVAARLQQDNIACVYDAFDDDLGTVLISELVEGPTLRELSAHLARLPDEAVAAIGAQLAHGAAAAASVGLTHRELSPSQVRVTHDGTVKILGLGSARLLGDDEATPIVGRATDVTYLAPEQLESGRSDHRSDIYTIGLMLWELSAGALPFAGDLDERLGSDVPPLRTVRPSVSPRLSATIERAGRRRPDDRWQDPQELGSRLLEECAARPKQVVRDVAGWLLPDPPAPVSTLRSAAAEPARAEGSPGAEASRAEGSPAAAGAAGSPEPAPSDR